MSRVRLAKSLSVVRRLTQLKTASNKLGIWWNFQSFLLNSSHGIHERVGSLYVFDVVSGEAFITREVLMLL